MRSDEDHRRECEARSWIRQGYYYPDRVDALMADIARHRGQAAANILREEMRKQWLRRFGLWVAIESKHDKRRAP